MLLGASDAARDLMHITDRSAGLTILAFNRFEKLEGPALIVN